jgi:hypothetical protein
VRAHVNVVGTSGAGGMLECEKGREQVQNGCGGCGGGWWKYMEPVGNGAPDCWARVTAAGVAAGGAGWDNGVGEP